MLKIKELLSRLIIFLVIMVITHNLLGQIRIKDENIKPGKEWKDIKGDPIQAHMGCVLYDNGTYYWYGMRWTGPTLPPNTLSNQNFQWLINEGISIYSSKNLYEWKFEDTVLKANYSSSSLLQPLNGLFRPKVIKNDKTGKYILMAALISPDYNIYNDIIYAVSERPTGPFEFKGKLLWHCSSNISGMWNNVWPVAVNDPPERIRGWDMTLFKDSDNKAYLIVSHDISLIYELSDDYQSVVKCEIMHGTKGGEAPVMFKHRGMYYFVQSGLSGWNPNSNFYCVSSSIDGPWENKGTFARGTKENTTFDSQVNFVLNLEENHDDLIFMADRFNLKFLNQSTYIWLPIEFNVEKHTMSVKWQKQWNINKLSK